MTAWHTKIRNKGPIFQKHVAIRMKLTNLRLTWRALSSVFLGTRGLVEPARLKFTVWLCWSVSSKGLVICQITSHYISRRAWFSATLSPRDISELHERVKTKKGCGLRHILLNYKNGLTVLQFFISHQFVVAIYQYLHRNLRYSAPERRTNGIYQRNPKDN